MNNEVNAQQPDAVLPSVRAQVFVALARPASAGVLLSAAHLNLYEQGFRHIATVGALFLLDRIGGPVPA